MGLPGERLIQAEDVLCQRPPAFIHLVPQVGDEVGLEDTGVRRAGLAVVRRADRMHLRESWMLASVIIS